MIEDSELQDLFQAESEERLSHLEKGLKELEGDVFNQEVIEGIFRDAHTIKGAARMLEVISIEKIAHQMEEMLDGIRKKKYSLTPTAIAGFYEAIDAMRALVVEVIQKKPSRVNVDSVLRGLNIANLLKLVEGEATSSTPASPPAQPPTLKVEAPVIPPPEKKEIETESEASKLQKPPNSSLKPNVKAEEDTAKIIHRVASHSLHSPTIRIQTKQLNELMAQAGNLTVAKNRIYGLLEQTDQLVAYLEKLSRIERWRSAETFKSQGKDSIHQDFHREDYDNVLGVVLQKLNQLRSTSAEDFHVLGGIITSISDRIRKLGLVPLSNLFDLFPRMVSDLANSCGKEIDCLIDGGEISVDKRIIEEMKDPIMHMLRNAISHGIESPEERSRLSKNTKGKIELKAYQTSNKIVLEVSDDGRGLDIDKIKNTAIERKVVTPEELEVMTPSEIQALIFMPGFSTASAITEISGRGVGMDVVQSHIEKLNGTIQVESKPGLGCQIYIQLPITLVTTHVMLVEVEKSIYAIPIDMIEACELISSDELFTIEGKDAICIDDQPISVALLADLLEMKSQKRVKEENGMLSCLILKISGKRVAIVVDVILEEQQIVVIPPNYFFGGIRTLAGATILKTGKVCVVLNAHDLIKDIDRGVLHTLSVKKKIKTKDEERKKRILFADDSYTMRVIIKRSLEEEGFEVVTAEDGMDALDKLKKSSTIDAIVSDYEMPKMDGILLTKKIRLIQSFYSLPIILYTTVSDEEKKKEAIDAGATIYLIKTEYNQNLLVKALQDLLLK